MNTQPAHSTRRSAWLVTGLLLAGATWAGGCNIVGPAVFFVAGPEKIPAAYTLPKDKTAVVFVDDRTNRVPSRATREIIGKTAEDLLLENGAVADMVQSRRVQTVIARERFGKPMGIAEVGRALGAKVVIYCWIDEFKLSEDGQSLLPVAAVRVKVIDAETKERLFPGADDPTGWHVVRVNPPPQQGGLGSTLAERNKAEQDLARWVGRSLAGVFYERSSELQPRRLEE